MTTLKRGDYCCPSAEAEWKSILDLAKALGHHTGDMERYPYRDYGRLWYTCEMVSQFSNKAQTPVEDGASNELSVPDFIVGMYAMKEAKERKQLVPELQDRLADAHLKDTIKGAIEPLRQELLSANGRITKLEVKSLLLDDILKRLTTLEEKKPLLIDMLARLTTLEAIIASHKLGLERHHDRLKVLGEVCGNLDSQMGKKVYVSEALFLEERITKLEEAINDRIMKEREFAEAEFERCKTDKDYCMLKYVTVKSDVPYSLAIDPAASPKNIPFSIALEYLRAGLVALACRVWVDDGDESGWLWAVSNGTIYQEGGRIVSECEMDDDYDFTHWLPLPNVPLSKKPPESPSNSPDPISGPSSHPSGDNAPESE